MSTKGTIINLVTQSVGIAGVVNTTSVKAAALPPTVGATMFDKIQTISPFLSLTDGEISEKKEVRRLRNTSFERFAQNFANSEPEILFVVDYIVDDKLSGCLLVWEKFFDATHYEVFKKNLFKENSKFERILFLDSVSLEEEKKYFIDYLRNTVGLNVDPKKSYVMLDTMVKEDRIYEYKIAASRVPKSATEVDYDMVLEGKNKVKKITIDSTSNNDIFTFTGNVLGSRDLAWTVALLNETLTFFGKGTAQKPISTLLTPTSGEVTALIASDLNDIMKIVNESVSLFGYLPTFEKLIAQCNGLSGEFRTTALSCIDETKGTFSYDKFRDAVTKEAPVFKLVLKIAESTSANVNGVQELSKLSITVPTNTGIETLASVENITKILKFINDVFIAVLYAQDKDVSEKLQDILKRQQENATTTSSDQGTNSTVVNAAGTSTNSSTSTSNTSTQSTQNKVKIL